MKPGAFIIKFHNFIVRILTSFIFIKEVRKRIRTMFLAQETMLKGGGLDENSLVGKLRQFYTLYGEPVEVGKNTYLGSPFRICSPDTKIGKFCSISWDVNIGTTHHPTDWLSTHVFQYNKSLDIYDIVLDDDKVLKFDWQYPVEIGNDVWIGCDVTIMDGIKIGDGAIVGAGAVVTKNIPPYAIAAGVPAKIIRYRFDEKTIKDLLELKWWDLDDEIIKTLPFNDVQACINKLKAIRGIP